MSEKILGDRSVKEILTEGSLRLGKRIAQGEAGLIRALDMTLRAIKLEQEENCSGTNGAEED